MNQDHNSLPPTRREGEVPSEAKATVRLHEATCYEVRDGWAWAHIFVRNGTSGDRHWVHLSAICDYGSLGYCWTHIGEDWRSFLRGLDKHYAGQKLWGERFRVPLDGREAQAKALALILDGRRKQGWEKADARTLYDAAKEAEPDEGCQAFFRDWDGLSGGLFYRMELWDARWDKINPQAEGFWADIWPHFIAALAEDTSPSTSVGGSELNSSSTKASDNDQP